MSNFGKCINIILTEKKFLNVKYSNPDTLYIMIYDMVRIPTIRQYYQVGRFSVFEVGLTQIYRCLYINKNFIG